MPKMLEAGICIVAICSADNITRRGVVVYSCIYVYGVTIYGYEYLRKSCKINNYQSLTNGKCANKRREYHIVDLECGPEMTY